MKKLVLIILLAGCAAPAPVPPAEDPVTMPRAQRQQWYEDHGHLIVQETPRRAPPKPIASAAPPVVEYLAELSQQPQPQPQELAPVKPIHAVVAAALLVAASTTMPTGCALQPAYTVPATQPGQAPTPATPTTPGAVLTPNPTQTKVVEAIDTAASVAPIVPGYGTLIGLGLSSLATILAGLWGVKQQGNATTSSNAVASLVGTISTAVAAGHLTTSTPAHADALQAAVNTASAAAKITPPTLATPTTPAPLAASVGPARVPAGLAIPPASP